jgi:hypothetical protein
MDIGRELREHADVVVVFGFGSASVTHVRKVLPCFSSDEEVAHVMAYALRGPYEALVFDRRAHAAGAPHLFFCKAPWPARFLAKDRNTIQLRAYEPQTQLAAGSNVLIFGPSGCGKSTLARSLLRVCVNNTVAFCADTDIAAQEDYEQQLPRCVVRKFTPAAVVSEIETHVPSIKLGLVLDDCLGDADMPAEIMGLLLGKRHAGLLGLGIVTDAVLAERLQSSLDVVIVFPTECALLGTLLPCLGMEELRRVFAEGLCAREALVFDRRAFKRNDQCLFYYSAAM